MLVETCTVRTPVMYKRFKRLKTFKALKSKLRVRRLAGKYKRFATRCYDTTLCVRCFRFLKKFIFAMK
jgi:hypothetical protein